MARIRHTAVRNAGDARVAASAAASAQPRNVAGVRHAGVRKATNTRKPFGTGKPHRFRPGTQALRQIR
jgi:hypothetical protein